ncbi:MAG: hypothetical protein GKR88_16485 [Flavobacteriaceae bacterium]|nr:MAG: hypothetical protein GKR88_16485 [Flavobacteriaceae bacterium]
MKTSNILLTFLLIFFSCTAQKQTESILKNIYTENIEFHKNEEVKKSEKLAYSFRKKLAKEGKLDFISLDDTLYILEGYDLETGETYTSIWNKTTGVSYVDDNKKLYQFSNEVYISKGAKKLLKEWNIKKIKSLQKGHETALIGGLDINVCKISFNKEGKVEDIKRFSFEQYDGFFKEIELVEPE